MHRAGVVAVLTLMACSAPLPADELSVQALPVVYGQDDRRELYQIDDPALAAAARAVVAIIPREDIATLADGTARWSAITAAESVNLCPDQPFAAQPALAICTAALIDDDLVLTAGHCFAHALDCRNFVLAFDYAYRAPGELAWGAAPELLECERVVVQETVAGFDDPDALDFAIVQLTAPASGRTPLPLRSTPLTSDEPIGVISATLGVPLKVDRGGHVLDARPDQNDFFVIDSDTFHGSSGAPVLDRQGALLGIFVRGHEDFGYDAQRACSVVSTRPSPTELESEDAGFVTPDAEEATYVARAVDALCSAGYPSERLCQRSPRCGDGFCSHGEAAGSCSADCMAAAQDDRATARDAGMSLEPDAGEPQGMSTDDDSLEPKALDGGCAVIRAAHPRCPLERWVWCGLLPALLWIRRRDRAFRVRIRERGRPIV